MLIKLLQSIDSTLKDIRDELRKSNSKPAKKNKGKRTIEDVICDEPPDLE